MYLVGKCYQGRDVCAFVSEDLKTHWFKLDEIVKILRYRKPGFLARVAPSEMMEWSKMRYCVLNNYFKKDVCWDNDTLFFKSVVLDALSLETRNKQDPYAQFFDWLHQEFYAEFSKLGTVTITQRQLNDIWKEENRLQAWNNSLAANLRKIHAQYMEQSETVKQLFEINKKLHETLLEKYGADLAIKDP